VRVAKDELENRLWKMHQQIAKGQWTSRQLHTCLEVLELVPENCSELMELVEVLHNAILAKSDWDQVLEQSHKRDTLKSFQQSVAAVMERGEAAEWIQIITKEELTNHGGETNRLFQLLVEGKKAHSLFVDSVTLANAAERTDLFSEKQCNMLQERSTQVHALMLEEQERLVQEQAQLERDEELRRDMERRAQIMPRHTVVQLVNLKHRQDLNMQLGYYMGVQGDRYVIQLVGSLNEVALKEENFVKWQPGDMNEDQKETSCSNGDAEPEPDEEDDDDDDSIPIPVPARRAVATPTVISMSPSSSPSSSQGFVSSKKFKIADQCNKPVATIYIHKKDVSFFIGNKGINIKRLQQTSGATNIHVSKDAVQEGLVPVRVEGRPQCVQKAVQMTESSYEVFLKPPPSKCSPASKLVRSSPFSEAERSDLTSPLSFVSRSLLLCYLSSQLTPFQL
jgi:hypothetical protein